MRRLSPPAFILLLILPPSSAAAALSSTPPQSNPLPFDRFIAIRPATLQSIRSFDPNLIPSNNDDDKSTWVAIYRSNNNNNNNTPKSINLRDDLFNAMKIATDPSISSQTLTIPGIEMSVPASNNNNNDNDNNDKDDTPMNTIPLAVGQISPSSQFPGKYTLQSLRCTIPKEKTDISCDGGSEHTEALSICIDELIIHQLESQQQQQQTKQQTKQTLNGLIRCKATLVSGPLLEDRGFVQVTTLNRDMTTHVSDMNESLMRYADRVASSFGRFAPGVRDRALRIVSLLGRLDVGVEDEDGGNEEEGSEDYYDPWANVRL